MPGPHSAGAMEGASVKLRGPSPRATTRQRPAHHLPIQRPQVRRPQAPQARGLESRLTTAVHTDKQYAPPASSVLQRLAL